MIFFFSLFLLGRKQRRNICGGENTGVAKDGLIRFRWLREPKGGQVLFTKTMRVISQLYKGPIVQDNEIMISSPLRLPIGKELHSRWKATIRARGQNPSKGRALRPALPSTGSWGGLCFQSSQATLISHSRCGSHWLLKSLLGAEQSCEGCGYFTWISKAASGFGGPWKENCGVGGGECTEHPLQ